MLQTRLVRRALVLGTCAMALLVAAPAGAATYAVSGSQTAVNEEQGIYKMRGGLIGRWTITSFEEVAQTPIFHGRGTEKFKGCIDRRRDRSCKGDPSGTLSFTFRYWGLFALRGPGIDRLGLLLAPGRQRDGRLRGRAGRARRSSTRRPRAA